VHACSLGACRCLMVVLGSYVSSLGVSRAFRRQGVARTLLRHVLQLAAHRPLCAAVGLHVRASNVAAMRLYEKCGFVAVRVIPMYYHDEDGVFMARLTLNGPTVDTRALHRRRLAPERRTTERMVRAIHPHVSREVDAGRASEGDGVGATTVGATAVGATTTTPTTTGQRWGTATTATPTTTGQRWGTAAAATIPPSLGGPS